MERRIRPFLETDLTEKMVLLAGPRQSGKTTLAEQILEKWNGAYFNWDVDIHRKQIRNSVLDETKLLWVFDELHKFRSWRNWLKGVYDLHKKKHRILVTGSARLDLYRRGGDSLQGRYFFHRLHPVTLSELTGIREMSDPENFPALPVTESKESREALDEMLNLGGFPEPLLSGSKRRADRWRLQYGSLLVRQDIRDLERIQDLDKMELLFERLPHCVGSVLSLNSLREDLEVSFPTMKNWMQILERTYAAFRIAPFGAPRIKAVKKEQKLYLWDWARVEDQGARLENLVAVHLLRFVHWLQDVEGVAAELRYFRDVGGHEVDFILMKNAKPWIAIEVKTQEQKLDSGLRYLLERAHIPHAFQISLNGENDFRTAEINRCKPRLLPARRFLINLP